MNICLMTIERAEFFFISDGNGGIWDSRDFHNRVVPSVVQDFPGKSIHKNCAVTRMIDRRREADARSARCFGRLSARTAPLKPSLSLSLTRSLSAEYHSRHYLRVRTSTRGKDSRERGNNGGRTASNAAVSTRGNVVDARFRGGQIPRATNAGTPQPSR